MAGYVSKETGASHIVPRYLVQVHPLFPATFTKFNLIKLGKPPSYVISFRMQEIRVFSDLENLNFGAHNRSPNRASSTPRLGPSCSSFPFSEPSVL